MYGSDQRASLLTQQLSRIIKHLPLVPKPVCYQSAKKHLMSCTFKSSEDQFSRSRRRRVDKRARQSRQIDCVFSYQTKTWWLRQNKLRANPRNVSTISWAFHSMKKTSDTELSPFCLQFETNGDRRRTKIASSDARRVFVAGKKRWVKSTTKNRTHLVVVFYF